ncbi:uncharacterized protein LOC128228419 [Mya arenaria]|uniref:uncharacterized protein LOC128228419 n=1 Tax=Mya arenaria TaxID=6604 RepID=UPI0022E854D3|nr:uncharacterized protein LOC128228419 [Mya arenaria]
MFSVLIMVDTRRIGIFLLCFVALSAVHGQPHHPGDHDWDDHSDDQDHPPGEEANIVLCAHVKEWPSGVQVYPGLVCPVHCCQRNDHVECCEEEEPEPVEHGKGRMLALIIVASLLAVLSIACFAFGCYKHKKAKLRKTRPTGSPNDVPVRLETISGGRYTVPRRAAGWGEDFKLPPSTTSGKYKIPDGPPTYSQATNNYPTQPPPYTSPEPPIDTWNAGSGKETPIPPADVPIATAPSGTVYLSSS